MAEPDELDTLISEATRDDWREIAAMYGIDLDNPVDMRERFHSFCISQLENGYSGNAVMVAIGLILLRELRDGTRRQG